MTLAQALILRGPRVLLGRWKSGAFAGRISGLLSDYPGALPTAAAVQAGSDLAGVCLDPRLLSCRALFTFHEQDVSAAAAEELGTTYEEYQFVYDADVADALRRNHPDLDVPEFGDRGRRRPSNRSGTISMTYHSVRCLRMMRYGITE